jgi:PASTA domain
MRLLACAALACAAVLIPAASSQAACYSSTPASQSFADSSADGDLGLAPEIAQVDATLNGACVLTVNPLITNRPVDLLTDDIAGIYLDTDGNPATGSPTFNGADRVVIQSGTLYPGVGTWDGSSFNFAGSPTLPVAGVAGFSATLDQLGMPAPATIGLRVATLWQGIYDDYLDFAPEPLAASFPFSVGFSTSPPPPPPPPPAPVNGQGGGSQKLCTVPSLRGKTIAEAKRRMKKAGCRYRLKKQASKKRKGRVLSTSPTAGESTSRVVTIRVSSGPRKVKKASASAYARMEALLEAASS